MYLCSSADHDRLGSYDYDSLQVFFSSSAQIGRLIENLSRDKEAGSFNIAPDRHYGHTVHSTASSIGSASDVRWTLEERLEQMLGSVSPNT